MAFAFKPVSQPQSSSSDDVASKVIETVELPFRAANNIVTSLNVRLLMTAILLTTLGVTIAFNIDAQCYDVTKIAQFGINGATGAKDGTFGKILVRDGDSYVIPKISGSNALQDVTALDTLLGAHSSNHGYVNIKYHTVNPVDCLHENKGNREVIMSVSLTMAVIYAISGVYMFIMDIVAIKNEGFTFTHLVSMLGTCAFTSGYVLGLIFVYYMVDHMHQDYDNPSDTLKAHRRGTHHQSYLMVISGVCMCVSALTWIVTAAIDVGVIRNLRKSDYYKYLPKYLVGQTSLESSNGRMGAHPLSVSSSMRNEQLFSFAFFAAIFLVSMLAVDINRYRTGDETAPDCDNCYIEGKNAIQINVTTTGVGNELSLPSVGATQTPTSTLAVLKGHFRMYYHQDHVVTPSSMWLIRHEMDSYGKGAIALLVIVGVFVLLNAGITLGPMFMKSTAAQDNADAVAYVVNEQRLPRLAAAVASSFMALSLPGLAFDFIYMQAGTDETDHYDVIKQMAGWANYIACAGVVGIIVYGVLSVVEWTAPVKTKLDAYDNNDDDNDDEEKQKKRS